GLRLSRSSPTSTFGDVGAMVHPPPMDAVDRRVGPAPGLGDSGPSGRHVERTAAPGDEAAGLVTGHAGTENSDAGQGRRVVDALDDVTRPRRRRVALAGKDDRDAGVVDERWRV